MMIMIMTIILILMITISRTAHAGPRPAGVAARLLTPAHAPANARLYYHYYCYPCIICIIIIIIIIMIIIIISSSSITNVWPRACVCGGGCGARGFGNRSETCDASGL